MLLWLPLATACSAPGHTQRAEPTAHVATAALTHCAFDLTGKITGPLPCTCGLDRCESGYCLEGRQCAADPGTTLSWNVRAVIAEELATCFVGTPCVSGECCTFATTTGPVSLTADATLRSIAPADAPAGAACVHTHLDADEQLRIRDVIAQFAAQTRDISKGWLDVRTTVETRAFAIALDRMPGMPACSFFWPSPSSVRAALGPVALDIDSVAFLFDTLADDGAPAIPTRYCDAAPSALEGVGGAGYVALPRSKAWANDDLGCLRPINLHHGVIGHHLDAALAIAGWRNPFATPGSQISRWNPDVPSDPPCGTQIDKPFFPDIHEEDPGADNCGMPWATYCASLGTTHDECNRRTQEHRLTHADRRWRVAGNHCRDGRADADEDALDCGGSDCARCPAWRPHGSIALADATWTATSSGWGPLERDHSNGERLADDGRTLSIGGHRYARGLGVHAPSNLVLALGRHCRRFTADVGVDDETHGQGSVVFEVWVDGVRRATSTLMHGGQAAAALDAPLTHAMQIELRVTDGGDGASSDHADWADAILDCN